VTAVRYTVTAEAAGAVLSALRRCDGQLTWNQARRLMHELRLGVNGIVCIDEGRRVQAGDVLEVRQRPFPPVPGDEDVRILWLDALVVVAAKPAGMLSVRHPGDRDWSEERKRQQPSLEESLGRLIRRREGGSGAVERRGGRPSGARTQRGLAAPGGVAATDSGLLAVHRIDRETSGILVFARTEESQQFLIHQFAAHTVLRRYLCVVPGQMSMQTLRSRQVRDRGDGLRGSTDDQSVEGLDMVTHVKPLRRFEGYTELECRLETGRTNQIRIQLSELGYPLCGDVKYRGPFGGAVVEDSSGAPGLALHAAELGFRHPGTKEQLSWQLPWPSGMLRWLDRLSRGQ